MFNNPAHDRVKRGEHVLGYLARHMCYVGGAAISSVRIGDGTVRQYWDDRCGLCGKSLIFRVKNHGKKFRGASPRFL